MHILVSGRKVIKSIRTIHKNTMLMLLLTCILMAKSETVTQYEYITVPFNTNAFESEWANYTVSKYISDTEYVFVLHYLNLGTSCRMPRLSVSVTSTQFDGYRYVSIWLNDVHIYNKCKGECFNLESISTRLGSDIDLLNWSSSLKLTFQRTTSTPATSIITTLHCWIPSITLPKNNEMWININQSLSTETYHNFSHTYIQTTENLNNDIYSYYYFTQNSEPCYNPKLTISTLDTDFDGTNYLNTQIYNDLIPYCYPNGNTCSNYYKCLDFYSLQQPIINNFFRIRTSITGINYPCKFNSTTFVLSVTIVTLSCYVKKVPTINPTPYPTLIPTETPTVFPTYIPTHNPTSIPTNNPTMYPTHAPTNNPSLTPTKQPTTGPTPSPTVNPTTVTKIPT
eukprot:450666_1